MTAYMLHSLPRLYVTCFSDALENGADPNAAIEASKPFAVILRVGSFQTLNMNNRRTMLEQLIDHGANPNETEWHGEKKTPLTEVVISSNLNAPTKIVIINKLMEKGAYPLKQWPKQDPPIHASISFSNHIDVIKALLSRYKAEQLNSLNYYNYSPLFYAVNQPEILKYLLSVGANHLIEHKKTDQLNGLEKISENVLSYTKKLVNNPSVDRWTMDNLERSVKTLEFYNEKLSNYFCADKLKKMKEVPELQFFPPGLLPIICDYLITDLPEREQDRAHLVQEYYLVTLRKTEIKRTEIILLITQLPISNIDITKAYLGEEPEADILGEYLSTAQTASATSKCVEI